ncbi:DUF4142 domain-containing protein [Massilia atriviolacea]|uniref:DUF4142 domain-containing protein n=1 Tax=Massilia atriviolacea TaxID=2495579 RepID=A0A430HKX6_9BURK|nr:DUF4142 domain-containing protein [Massilia atriviolacea]RSZ58151.1 DUF4142 domain-containing protein [Massilia atriviolacea]
MLKKNVMQCALGVALAATFAMPASSYAQNAKATMDTPAASALNKADQTIVADMARANMAEIEAGKLALTNSQNAQVKAFAQQMIDDHTKALGDVTQLAQSKGVTLPTELDSKHKAMAAKLGKLNGDAFDKAYMAQAGVGDHKAVHAALKKFEAKAKDPDVKALAAKMLPTVEQHLHAATDLAGTRGGAKGGKAPVTGEANDHTSPAGAAHGAGHGAAKVGAKTPAPAAGVKPPVVGEANEQNAGKR